METREVAFTADGVRLIGTVRTPADGASAPATLLISGSGPINRDSDARRLPLGVMRAMADHLAARGVGSLRYDKRGVGASGGSYHSTGFVDNVVDARAALAALRSEPWVDPSRIFLVGHSEGALIAGEVARTDAAIAGVVLLAGSARSGREVLRWQGERVAETLPRPVRWLLRVLRQDLRRTQERRLAQLEASTKDVVRMQFVRVNARWFREFMAYDPARALAAVPAPVLAVTGSKDLQVDPADIEVMRRVVMGPFTGEVATDLTHLLRREPGPASMRTYRRQARRPVDAGLLDVVGSWILDRSAATAGHAAGG